MKKPEKASTKINRVGIFYLLTSTFLYSIMPVLIRFLGANKIPPMSQVFLRYIFAFISAATYFFIISKSKLQIKKKDIPMVILVSVFGYALSNLFFTYGTLFTQVSNALFIFYSYGIITPILAYFFLKEKLNKYNAVSLALTLISLLLLFQPNSVATWKLGAIFAVLAALGQSFYFIGRRKLANYDSKTLLLTSTFLGVLTLGLLSLVFENSFYQQEISNLSPRVWLVTLLFGLDNFLAWLFMTKGFRLIQASTGSVIMLLENVFAVIIAFTFLNEAPTFFTLMGGFLILTSSILVALKGAE
jgi:drug/metabolite transporter (DMT)-like permease